MSEYCLFELIVDWLMEDAIWTEEEIRRKKNR